MPRTDPYLLTVPDALSLRLKRLLVLPWLVTLQCTMNTGGGEDTVEQEDKNAKGFEIQSA